MNAEAIYQRADQAAALATWIAATLRRIRIATLVAAALLVAGVGMVADWSAGGVVVAVVVGLFGLAGVLALTFFAHNLDRAADLPRLIREDLPGITVKARDSLYRAAEGMEAQKGSKRIVPTLKGMWRLRRELQELAEEDLAPAQSLISSFHPFRLIPMVVAVVSTPVMFVLGLLLLVVAALI